MADVRGTRAWRVLREQVFKQQGRECAHCGGTDELEVDHIIPYSEAPELGLDITNLQVLCKSCHEAKTHNKENKAVRRNWYDPKWLTSIN